ncbi:MAG: type II secretion system F family protein [Clostridium sp.]|uniref:type II secretion system F family protein n=1 Tax=Clostridium sp. TaxID=1506 RepID=UPI003F2B2160
MILFKYEAKSLDGKKIKGKIKAENEIELRRSLKNKGYYVTNVYRESKGLNIDLGELKKVEDSNYANVCREMSFSLKAGVSILETLEMVKDGGGSKKLGIIMEAVYVDVKGGKLLSEALKKHKEIPNLLWSMVSVGEETGNLDDIMEELGDYYTKQFEQNKKVKNAVLYPKFLIFFSLIVVGFLAVYIVPMLVSNLIEAKGNLPLPTKIVISISGFIENNCLIIIIAIVILILFKKLILNKSYKYKYMRDKYILKSRFFGKITTLLLTARFSRTFGALFGGGVSVIRCFEVTANVIGNTYFKEKLLEGREIINKGGTIGEALEFYNILPSMMIKTIKVGEKSGSLDKILRKSTAYYEIEANFKLDRLTKLIEPIMIIILSLLIGFIIVSIMLPIFSMYNAIGN